MKNQKPMPSSTNGNLFRIFFDSKEFFKDKNFGVKSRGAILIYKLLPCFSPYFLP
jgi:hypothetical protein